MIHNHLSHRTGIRYSIALHNRVQELIAIITSHINNKRNNQDIYNQYKININRIIIAQNSGSNRKLLLSRNAFNDHRHSSGGKIQLQSRYTYIRPFFNSRPQICNGAQLISISARMWSGNDLSGAATPTRCNLKPLINSFARKWSRIGDLSTHIITVEIKQFP